MESLVLEEVIGWIYTLSVASILTIFFVIAWLENVFPFVPGDMLIVFGGYLAAQDVISFVPLWSVTTLGALAGFVTMYGLGAIWGYRIVGDDEHRWFSSWIDDRTIGKGKRWMQKWGQWVILFNRFLAGTRSVIALTAGIYRTRVRTTLINATLSSLAWNWILIGLGWIVHDNWQVIGDYLQVYGWVVGGGIVAYLLYRQFIRKGKKKRVRG
ncbi:MAG: DedA family protein [Balneolaceae bacterium]